jgi:hypothetical protein
MYYTFVKSQLANVVDPAYIDHYLTRNKLLYKHMFCWMDVQLHLWNGSNLVYGVRVRSDLFEFKYTSVKSFFMS